MKTLLLALLSFAWFASAQAAAVIAPHVEVELISESTALHSGDNTVALRIKPESGWHTYWLNPGDTGQATLLRWQLPDGISAGDIQWPYPSRFKVGNLINYGYGEETLHLVTLHVADKVLRAAQQSLRAEARWLVCAEICIPGRAELTLTLPVAKQAQSNPRWQSAFENARRRLPAHPDLSALYDIKDGALSLSVGGLDLHDARVSFFPLTRDLLKLDAEPRQKISNGLWTLTQALAEGELPTLTRVEGVLLAERAGSTQAYAIAAQAGHVAAVAADSGHSLLLILFFALIGGLILNLMPCVFPVLSLKALALVQHRDTHHHEQRRHALAYTAGVLASFAVVAGVLIALRAGGDAIGWGFQLQSSVFVAALAYLLFALGLSLSGVVEFGGRFMGIGQKLATRSGLSGSFFTGVLATVVASPCSAPFMGTALGYAATQAAPMALLIFLALGLGLALPFLLLGFFPRLGAWLPRPGAWMQTFKQAMAFPLYLSVVWLVWIVMQQSGNDAAALTLIGLVLVTFALWLWHRSGRFAAALKILALLLALALLAHPALRPSAATLTTQQHADAEPYSEERLAALRAEHRTAFVNLTADWCLTCKLNERTTLQSDAVQKAFAEQGVTVLVGDWTRADPVITQTLARFGRDGVPLYLLYAKGGEPRVLPQILTPKIVLDALPTP